MQRPKAMARGDAPDLGGRVVASRDDKVAVDFEAADACLVAHQRTLEGTVLDVPYPEGGVAGSGDGCVGVRHL